MSEHVYKVGDWVRYIKPTHESAGITNANWGFVVGKEYEIEDIDGEGDLYFCDHSGYLSVREVEPVPIINNQPLTIDVPNPFEPINRSALLRLLAIAGQLVAAYDDCDENTRQMLPFVLKIGNIEVKRES